MKTIQYKDAVNLEQDLIDKPNWSDAIADAFNKAGSAPVAKPGDFEANAALLGMSAGHKGIANEKRAQQSAPILEEAGRIRAKAAEIEAQTQESEQSRLMVTQLFKQSAVPIAQLSQASLARDVPASNEIAKGIYLNFKRALGDPTIGDFDHYHNGVIYYENLETGNIEGKNVIGLMYQAGIDPKTIWGQDAPMIEAGLSPGAKKSYEDSEKMRQLEMEGKRADVSLKQAHAGVYQQQANQIQNEIANPPKEKGTIDPQKLSEDLDVISKQIKTIGDKGEQKGFSRVMSEITPGHTWQLTPEQTQIDTLGQLLRGQMFKAFGYRNETEFEQIPTISSNNSVKQNQSIIEQYKNLYLKGQQTQKNKQVSNNNDSSETISLFDPTTNEYYDVPTKEAEALHNKYPHLVRQ
jgi:hypothetical protein